MKRLRSVPIVMFALILHSCVPSAGGLDVLKYLQPGEATLKLLPTATGGAAVVTNGTNTPINAVTVRFDGTVKAEDVKGALSCSQVDSDTVTCRVDAVMPENQGRALYYKGTVTASLLAYNQGGKVYVVPGS